MKNRALLEPEQKALEINLDSGIYGTFAEIGAGQEVARYFFQVGAAAGTIAKTMSAYDKIISDNIYGVEPSGRYVCESRLYKMLDHEYELMDTRLRLERPKCKFFVFADTIAAINYSKTIPGDGWLGLRFQLEGDEAPNDIVLHVRMLDNDNRLQQQAVGILGVNMIYACYHYHKNPEQMIESLIDTLRGRVAIDMVRLSGPTFSDLDNRLLSLWLVKHHLTDVAMFGPSGQNVHGSEFLYKKHVMIVRGSFRPLTHVNMDMLRSSFDNFRESPDVDASKANLLTEITIENLRNAHANIDEQDFLDRAKLLCEMGQTVVVSAFEHQQKLIDYLQNFKVQTLGLVVGVKPLMDLVEHTFKNSGKGEVLAAFGEVFTATARFYVYPILQDGSAELMTATTMPVPEEVKFLFRHLLENGQIRDVTGFHPEFLHIYSTQVLKMLKHDEPGWEDLVPAKVASIIKSQYLFGYPAKRITFQY